MEVAQAADDVVAEEIGTIDNDTDWIVTVMRSQMDLMMICLIQINLTMKWPPEKEVVKKLNQFQSENNEVVSNDLHNQK